MLETRYEIEVYASAVKNVFLQIRCYYSYQKEKLHESVAFLFLRIIHD